MSLRGRGLFDDRYLQLDHLLQRPLIEILADLKEARAELELADAALNEVLAKLGLS
jgi:hypothetical protein